ncbi:MAG: PDZ domain-containing protein [Pseudomonadales bacterium]
MMKPGLIAAMVVVIVFVTVTGVLVSRSMGGHENFELSTATIDIVDNLQSSEDPRISLLEAELNKLKDRVQYLESRPGQSIQTDYSIEEPAVALQVDVADDPTQRLLQRQSPSEAMKEHLVAAGLDQITANDIVLQRSEIELKRLELRDHAIREGYLRTERFRDEMMKIRAEETSLQEELGHEYYDRYLYISGQSNRIGVSSVMIGSAAEQSGINQGDLIVRYDDQPVFNGRDLQQASSSGERGELATVTLLRDGRQLSISLPRGPLGVRLQPVSVDPGQG